jgi:hypothetical protein
MGSEVNQLRQIHTELFKQESKMKSFLTQKSVSVDVWCRVQKFCRLRILLDKISLKEEAPWQNSRQSVGLDSLSLFDLQGSNCVGSLAQDIPMLKDLPQGLRVKLHQETGAQMQHMEKIRRAELWQALTSHDKPDQEIS